MTFITNLLTKRFGLKLNIIQSIGIFPLIENGIHRRNVSVDLKNSVVHQSEVDLRLYPKSSISSHSTKQQKEATTNPRKKQ